MNDPDLQNQDEQPNQPATMIGQSQDNKPTKGLMIAFFICLACAFMPFLILALIGLGLDGTYAYLLFVVGPGALIAALAAAVLSVVIYMRSRSTTKSRHVLALWPVLILVPVIIFGILAYYVFSWFDNTASNEYEKHYNISQSDAIMEIESCNVEEVWGIDNSEEPIEITLQLKVPKSVVIQNEPETLNDLRVVNPNKQELIKAIRKIHEADGCMGRLIGMGDATNKVLVAHSISQAEAESLVAACKTGHVRSEIVLRNRYSLTPDPEHEYENVIAKVGEPAAYAYLLDRSDNAAKIALVVLDDSEYVRLVGLTPSNCIDN